MNKRYFLSILLAMNSIAAFCQTDSQPEMADLLRQSGKIYTVVAVLGLILSGVFAYLLLLDRKMAKLEKQLEKKTRA